MGLTTISGTIQAQPLNDNFSYLNERKNDLVFNVKDYGATLDGITNDSDALIGALNAAASVAGTVLIPPSSSGMLISTTATITIPFGVTLIGANAGLYNDIYLSVNTGSVIKITGNAGNASGNPVFTMQSGSQIKNLSFNWPNQTATNPPVAYPYLVKGQAAVCNDCLIENIFLYNCYQFADFTGNHERLKIKDVYGDILYSGIVINNSVDVDRLVNVHFWPFFGTGTAISTYRANNAIGITINRADGFQASNIFIYGHQKGIQLGDGVNKCYGQITNYSADLCRFGIYSDSINPNGISIQNYDYAMSSASQTAYGLANSYAMFFGDIGTGLIEINNTKIWGGPTGAIFTPITFNGSAILNNMNVSAITGTALISHSGTTGTIKVRNIESSFNIPIATMGTAASTITIENPSLINETFIGTPAPKFLKYNTLDSSAISTASTASLTLPTNGDFFNIIGTTSITSITASRPGREVTFTFAEQLTVTDGSNLKLAGNFVTTANYTMKLICDGINWLEVSRSSN